MRSFYLNKKDLIEGAAYFSDIFFMWLGIMPKFRQVQLKRMLSRVASGKLTEGAEVLFGNQQL
jgi:hypothetical protein